MHNQQLFGPLKPLHQITLRTLYGTGGVVGTADVTSRSVWTHEAARST